MSANSKIEWTDHTWNPWWGCTRVSPGCANCYAEAQAKRFGVLWGKGQPRRPASKKVMDEPYKWDRDAKAEGIRRRVFVASMADWCDLEAPSEWRDEMWDVIANCKNLDLLMLTKRPENFEHCLPKDWSSNREKWSHVWLGVTVENQEQADRRIPILLRTPAAVRFLSCEPLLGATNFRKIVPDEDELGVGYDALSGTLCGNNEPGGPKIDWVICGGESGPGARPMHPDWARSLRDQCAEAGTAFFFKQWGEWVTEDQSPENIVLPGTSFQPWSKQDRDGEFTKGDQTSVYKVGKKSAGRLLDGVEHSAFPTPTMEGQR